MDLRMKQGNAPPMKKNIGRIADGLYKKGKAYLSGRELSEEDEGNSRQGLGRIKAYRESLKRSRAKRLKREQEDYVRTSKERASRKAHRKARIADLYIGVKP